MTFVEKVKGILKLVARKSYPLDIRIQKRWIFVEFIQFKSGESLRKEEEISGPVYSSLLDKQ